MRAARFHRYGDPSVLQIEQLATPRPGPNELLVRVYASSLNPADLGARSGLMRLIHARHLPHVPGYDMAGVVEACGAAVTAFLPGERVYALVGLGGGAQADYVCVDQSKVAVAPERLSLSDAAAVPLGGLTALQGLRAHGRLQPGQRLLVNGASGGVGSFAVQLGKLLGCYVSAVCRGDKAAAVLALGADEVIDYSAEDFTQRPQTWNVVFDAAGNRELREVQRVLAAGGAMTTTRPSPTALLAGAVGRLGSGPRYRWFITQASGHDLALLTRLIDKHGLHPLVDRTFALEEIQAAHRYLESGEARGKVVVEVAQE